MHTQNTQNTENTPNIYMKSIAPKSKNPTNPQPPPVIILPMLHKPTICQAKNNENANNQKHQLHQNTNIQSAPYYAHNGDIIPKKHPKTDKKQHPQCHKYQEKLPEFRTKNRSKPRPPLEFTRVTNMSQTCHKCVTNMSQIRHKSVTNTSQIRHKKRSFRLKL